jgi:hypothetical protein
MSESSAEFTVVVAHGHGDVAIAQDVAAGLRGRRQATLTVAVADSDAPLLEACAKLGGKGLFVILRGRDLSVARVEALRAVLRDLGVPMSRSLGLGLDALTTAAFVDRVINVVRRIAPEGARSTIAPSSEMRVDPGLTPSPVVSLADRLEPRPSPPPGSPAVAPIVHSAAISVDSGHLDASPRRRRAAFGAGALALTAVVVWALVPRADNVRDDDVATRTSAATTTEPTSERTMPAREPSTREPSARDTSTPADAPTSANVAAPAAEAPPTAEDSEAVVAALRKREIRALDVFVVSPEAKKAADFAGATAYCAALEISGIKDWRLPEIGELVSMSRAKMVRKGSFWSSTKGDTFGDLRVVLVIKRERLSPIPAGWDGGRVICVRERS